MMAFDQPFVPAGDAFYDQADPQLLHVLHDTVHVSRSNGQAELTLALHAASSGKGGGLFQARFTASRRSLENLNSRNWNLADILRCRTKLTPRTEVSHPQSLGQWRDAVLDGDGGILLNFFLDEQDGELMRQLALGGTNALDLTMELTYLGVIRGYPYSVQAPGPELMGQLAAILGDGQVTADAIEAAFLSLPPILFQVTGADPARSPGRAVLIRETSRRALPLLFSPTGTGIDHTYVLKATQSVDSFAVSLAQPRKVLRTNRLNWSFSRFVNQLRTRDIENHFPLLRTIEPFSSVEIRALNQIPLDPKHVMVAKLDLKYPGRGGTQENTTLEFRPHQPILKSVSTVFPALTHPFKVESRLRLIIAPPMGRGFPKIWPRDAAFELAGNPFSIDVSPARADVGIVQMRALDGVFDYCRAVIATITHDGGKTTAEISRQSPEAWIALAGHKIGAQFMLRLEALPLEAANANRRILQDGPHTDPEIILSPIDLTVRAPTVITTSLDNDLVRFAVLDIRMTGRSHFSRRVLRPNDVVEVALWRSSIFDTLNYEWRVSAVRKDPSGRSLPIETSGWKTESDPILKIA